MRWPGWVVVVTWGVLLPGSLWTAGPPEPIAPAGEDGGEVIAAACPTFLWGSAEGARAHELVIYRLKGRKEELEAELRLRLPGSAPGWVPSLAECFEPGGHYAWSVGAISEEGEIEWSQVQLFRVATPPSALSSEGPPRHPERAWTVPGAEPGTAGERPGRGAVQRLRESVSEGEGPAGTAVREQGPEPDADGQEPSDLRFLVAAVAAPTPGAASLTVDQQIHLGAASSFFQEGELLLWDGGSDGNTALGRRALSANTLGVFNTGVGYRALRNNTEGIANTAMGHRALYKNVAGQGNTALGDRALTSNESGDANTAVGTIALQQNTVGYRNTAVGEASLGSNVQGYRNTAVGFNALGNNLSHRNTAVGAAALLFNTNGSSNSAFGNGALRSNTTGLYNTAAGASALFSNEEGGHTVALGAFALNQNTGGSYNTALGSRALSQLTTGSDNVAVGYGAGVVITEGSDNVLISHSGSPGDSATIRIGSGAQTRAFMAGIRGVMTGAADAMAVMIDSNGQLGTLSSTRRYKEAIRDMGEASQGILSLRPVTFRYRPEVAAGPRPLEFGLIAEEVAELYPDLVAYDDAGRPFAVRYHVLVPMLLNELQRLEEQVRSQEQFLAEQGRALDELKTNSRRVKQRQERTGARRGPP